VSRLAGRLARDVGVLPLRCCQGPVAAYSHCVLCDMATTARRDHGTIRPVTLFTLAVAAFLSLTGCQSTPPTAESQTVAPEALTQILSQTGPMSAFTVGYIDVKS